MEVTEEMIYTFAARFMDQRWAGEVNYNTDYEAHDTNYRMALIKSANEMVGDNEIVKALITKEIIAMLSPAEDIPEYENVYINTIVDTDLKTLMQENNDQVLSRDLEPSMIPEHEMYGEEDGKEEAEYDNENGESDNTSILGGAGTPVTEVGITYYTNQVAPAILLGGTAGR
jgi:hypothetical protein